MANQAHLRILRKGVSAWNKWRKANPKIKPDLTGIVFPNSNFKGINFSKVELIAAGLIATDLSDSNLSKANLESAHLGGANLSNANLRGANLEYTNFSYADLRKSDLTGAFLEGAIFVKSDLRGAILTGCYVYGISAWEVKLESAVTEDLIVTPAGTPEIKVGNLELAQFIYLLLRNQKIRGVIDTITSKVVLLLGRFSQKRKEVLESMKEQVRQLGYVPVLFDFPKSHSRDLTETIQVLAGMSKFVIADLTDAKSIPQELSAIIPNLPSVPIQPILLSSQKEYALFGHWQRYPWVLPIFRYKDQHDLINKLQEKVIKPALKKTV